MEANTPEEIDELRAMTITINDYDKTLAGSLISSEIRAIIDNALFMGAFGHRSRFEAVPGGVPVANRTAFYENSIKIAEDRIDDFYESWKTYRAANPVKAAEVEVEDSDTAALLDVFYGDNCDQPEAGFAVGPGAGSGGSVAAGAGADST